MKTPHKHFVMIREWALDTSRKVEFRIPYSASWVDIEEQPWVDVEEPSWCEACEYRFKPEPKLDHRIYTRLLNNSLQFSHGSKPNIEFTFDGETGELKAAKVLK